MFKLLLSFALVALTVGEYQRPLIFQPRPQQYNNFQFGPLFNNNNGRRTWEVILCTYSEIAYTKCLYTVQVAQNNSIPMNLQCVREDKRENCIESVENGFSDMVVLTGHGYKDARSAGLRPFLYAKEDDKSLYIAVAPRNITLIGVQEAPIIFDQSKHRAFHAATFFNLHMGHDICAFLNKVSLISYINIVDSADYVPNSEEVLICPNRLPDAFENYKRCNVEAGLQRAVFVRANLSIKPAIAIRTIFETIFEHFGPNSLSTNENGHNFKFFDTFQGQNDVIFKNNTKSFDLVPTYRNGVDENLFNLLHCNQDDQPHDPRELL